MKNYKYIGYFKNANGHQYQLEVYCNGFLQAFFLLTADAIRLGMHYQLDVIIDEKDNVQKVGDIVKCVEVLMH